MELFAAAGIDLPSSVGGKVARAPTVRTLRAPLFSHKVLKEARDKVAFDPTDAEIALAAAYAKQVRNPKFLNQKETSIRPVFFDQILKSLLGYKESTGEGEFSLAYEEPVRRGSVDVALGKFDPETGNRAIIAPFELKGPQTFDLDRIMPGRGRSPVQQAWDYAIDSPGSRWVLVSNCVEIRLYAFGRGREAYEVFDLTKLDDKEEFARLWLLLSAKNFLGDFTDKLLRDSDSAYKDVTNELYRDYKALRDQVMSFLVDSADGPRLASLKAIEIAQKTLDRVLFIAFAQRTDLLPDKLLELTVNSTNELLPQPIWKNFLALFSFVDKGNGRLYIPAYNGGLFAKDDIADDLILPDELAKEIAKLGLWDYKSEVSVNLLGHIFEQSITDIEKLKAESRGEEPPEISKSKRDGVVYTPDFVTRFLVEQTIVKTLNERLETLKQGRDMAVEADEKAVWQSYLLELRSLTIIDPACGSGAFLVAAFDELRRQYQDVTERLKDMGETMDFDIYDEIVTRNLYGVDLNAESVEITRLSLWLKTARRQHKLQNLADTIKTGNSLIEDKAYTDRPFNWRKAFPDVFRQGGFDIVLGNPPYVRMEFLKDQKPYLEEHYIVAADRSDLYAYFFEKGVQILKTNGRFGYISSSTFFRTGSGEKLRAFLGDKIAIESVVDFGDLQIFEGVTTYPAIITAKKDEDAPSDLEFLIVKEKPENLSRAFLEQSQQMPRARLTAGSWQFEGDALAGLRDKITKDRKTLGEVYGAPMRGILTGLNEAFIIDRVTRDRLVKADAKSEMLIKPFLKGENIKRWRVESDDRYLINTPKGKVDIEKYPAVRDWLLPFKTDLEKRATKQEWWELQQAQLAYQPKFISPKISYPHFQNERMFSMESESALSNDKSYFISTDSFELLGYLNSKGAWYFLSAIAPAVQNGWHEMRVIYVTQLPIPEFTGDSHSRLAILGVTCTTAARERYAVQSAVRHRLLDLAGPDKRKLTGKLEEWHTLDFKGFMAEIKKAFRAEIPVKQRGEWEAYLAENAAVVNARSATIAAAEQEIDAIVYNLFDLTPDEITLLETSLQGQY